MFYFTSDLHFGSEDTIKFDKRPFKNAKVFQNHIIKLWNKMKIEDDKLYVIGDFIDYRKVSALTRLTLTGNNSLSWYSTKLQVFFSMS